MERSKDLRAMMKKMAATAPSSVREEKVRIRQLKLAKEHKSRDGKIDLFQLDPVDNSQLLLSNRLLVEEDEIKKPKFKVATLAPSISALVQSSAGNSLAQEAKRESDNTEVVTIQVPNAIEQSPASGLPPGFFDNPFEDMEARGLEVKEELLKKDQKGATELQSFFGEVEQALASVESFDTDDEDAYAEETALQLAYAAKTANFLATSRATLDASLHVPDRETHRKRIILNEFANPSFEELDLMIESFTGEVNEGRNAGGLSKRGIENSTDMTADVIKILETKRQKRISTDTLNNTCKPFDYSDSWTTRKL